MMRTHAILAMALICPCFSASAEPIHLQLRWHHQFQFAGYYAALEKGYYKDAGLEVIIHEGTPEKKPLQEVLQGRAQYGEANSELLLARLRGAPLVALAAIYQHSPSVLIARKDAGIFSPDGLIGKKIMLLDQTVDADFIAMFNNEGIDISRLHIIPSSYEIRDLVDGKVDAFNSYLSNEPYFLKQQGIEFTVLNPRNYGVDFYSDILFTTEDELKRHPERVKAFRQASLEGWYYAMDHPQEIIDLLLNKYKVNKSRDHLNFEADAIRPLIVPDVIDLGHMNPWRWRHMAETFIKTGMAENDNFLQNFSYDPAPKADKEKLLTYIEIAAIITLLTSVITLTLLVSYRTLKQKSNAAKRNEKLLRLSHETAGIGYYLIDLATGRWESSPLLDKICGIDAHFDRYTANWATLIHPEHYQRVLNHYQEIRHSHERFSMECQIIRASDKQTRWIIAHGDIEFDNADNPARLVGTVQDITERKQAEQQLTRQLRHLKIMERITRVSATSENLEALLDGVLKEIKLIFDADRAWFLYPCDPTASAWTVPMERSHPEWPGAFARNMKIPVNEEVSELFQAALETAETLQYGPLPALAVPSIAAEEFSVKSQLLIALRPQIGSPWLLGIHHCSEAHIHDSDDLVMFTEIAQRVTEALSSLRSKACGRARNISACLFNNRPSL